MINEGVPYTEVQLKQDVWLAVKNRLSGTMMQHLNGMLRSQVFETAEGLVISLDACLFSHELGRKTLEVKYPADWRAAVYDRFAPAWAKQRWPVRYTVETLELSGHDLACAIRLPPNNRAGLIVVQGDRW